MPNHPIKLHIHINRYVHLFIIVFVIGVGEGRGGCFFVDRLGAGLGEADLASGLHVGVVVVHDCLHLFIARKLVAGAYC